MNSRRTEPAPGTHAPTPSWDPDDPSGHASVFSGPGLYAQAPGNRWHLYILDAEGTRLIAVILSYAQTPKTDLDLARNVIAGLDIRAWVDTRGGARRW
jgi:hypothetical protein